jgi:hypothetical protein
MQHPEGFGVDGQQAIDLASEARIYLGEKPSEPHLPQGVVAWRWSHGPEQDGTAFAPGLLLVGSTDQETQVRVRRNAGPFLSDQEVHDRSYGHWLRELVVRVLLRQTTQQIENGRCGRFGDVLESGPQVGCQGREAHVGTYPLDALEGKPEPA